MTEQNLADIGINQLRTPLVTVPGAAIPYPFGGKQRQVQIDLNSTALQARGLSGQDVANALAAQNLITPVGTQKIGNFEYTIQLNNSPLRMEELGDLPIKAVNGAMVYVRDVASVRDGNPPQTNIVHVDGHRSLLAAVVLIYFLIVVNFQSWSDPFVIITALPAALAGIVWMLFTTQTTLSVPALTGAIMCMGVATANSVLVISFARERYEELGDPVAAAH